MVQARVGEFSEVRSGIVSTDDTVSTVRITGSKGREGYGKHILKLWQKINRTRIQQFPSSKLGLKNKNKPSLKLQRHYALKYKHSS